jgi:hypothetical protein
VNRVIVTFASPWWTDTESQSMTHAPSPQNFQYKTNSKIPGNSENFTLNPCFLEVVHK